MFRSNTTAKPPSMPHFPTYLLPSLKIPFLRRGRQDSAATTSSTASNDIPSLSSSPVSPGSPTHEGLPSPIADAGNDGHPYMIPAGRDDFYHVDASTPTSPPPPLPHHDRNRLSRTLPDLLRCSTCGTDVAYGLQVVSKGFTGRHGRALLVSPPLSSPQPSCPASPPDPSTASAISSLFSSSATAPPGHHALARDGANLVNVTVGRPESRNLVTGAHVVADISCATCGVKIGWKYVDAREQAQKYKVGKFILETERVVLFRSWEDAYAGDEDDGGEFYGRRHFYSSSAPVGTLSGGVGPAAAGRRRSSIMTEGWRKGSCSSEGAAGASGLVLEEEEQVSGDNESESEEEEIVFDSDDEDECEDIFAGVWDAATVARRRGSKASGVSHHKKKKGREAEGVR